MSGNKIIIINGHRWVDVTDRTVAEPVYDIKSVILAGGRIPNFESGYNSDVEEDNGK